jgi:hypothetical protein
MTIIVIETKENGINANLAIKIINITIPKQNNESSKERRILKFPSKNLEILLDIRAERYAGIAKIKIPFIAIVLNRLFFSNPIRKPAIIERNKIDDIKNIGRGATNIRFITSAVFLKLS